MPAPTGPRRRPDRCGSPRLAAWPADAHVRLPCGPDRRPCGSGPGPCSAACGARMTRGCLPASAARWLGLPTPTGRAAAPAGDGPARGPPVVRRVAAAGAGPCLPRPAEPVGSSLRGTWADTGSSGDCGSHSRRSAPADTCPRLPVPAGTPLAKAACGRCTWPAPGLRRSHPAAVGHRRRGRTVCPCTLRRPGQGRPPARPRNTGGQPGLRAAGPSQHRPGRGAVALGPAYLGRRPAAARGGPRRPLMTGGW